MARQVKRRATAQPTEETSPLLPSELAGEQVHGACGWCITRDHPHCVQRNMRPDVICKCPCPKS